jgi:methylenetetrahydrofolate reductase (NADPH)
MESLREVLPSLVALDPRFMTVTYGAMGTTRIRTVEIASMIHNEFELECACHLTCVGAHSDQIDAQLDHIHRHGIENIVALRGDPPRGQDSFQAVKGGFSYANELVEHIRSRGGFDIAVGGYPEKHVEAPDMETDLSNLARKVEGGADVVITQLFYDNECFFRFLEEVRKRGITCPVIPGLLPIHSQEQVEKIAGLCGAEIPAELQRSLEEAGADPEAAAEVGVDWCIEQCSGLLEAGVEGIHYYVLNKARVMEKVMAGLRARRLLI